MKDLRMINEKIVDGEKGLKRLNLIQIASSFKLKGHYHVKVLQQKEDFKRL